jgi:outer membrane protein TolC
VWDKRIQNLDAHVAEQAVPRGARGRRTQTADAFFNLYAQQMTLRNASSNVVINDTLFTLNKGRFEVGKIGENDLLKTELALLRARAAAEDAAWRAPVPSDPRRQIAYPRDSR